MSRNAFPAIERELNEAQALREHTAIERADSMATAAKQPLTQGAEQEPRSFHDFRDRGDPLEKREAGARDWEHNQQREFTPGLGRR